MRATGLVCLGAGLIRGDLRDARGADVACRSGGMVVEVRGTRPRTVPVLDRYHARLLAAARTGEPGCPGWIICSQRLGDLVAGLEPVGESEAVRLLGAARRS
jgi:hypothetical protein